MNEGKKIVELQEFLDVLVKRTLNEEIIWKYAHDLIGPKMDYDHIVNYAICTDEFRQIDFHRSYYTFSNAGIIYLVYTMNMPGEDGFDPWDGYVLSLQTHLEEKTSILLSQQSEELYRLENAIRSKISDNYRFVPHDEGYYMELFLK